MGYDAVPIGMKSLKFWNSLYHHFQRIAESSSETSVTIYQSARRHIPDDLHLHQNRWARQLRDTHFCVGHIFLTNCFVHHGIEGEIEEAGRRVRRRKQLLDNFTETRRYWKLKDESSYRTLWRNGFVRAYGPVVRLRDYDEDGNDDDDDNDDDFCPFFGTDGLECVKCFHIWPSTSQAKVLTGGGDVREAQVDVPHSVSHSRVWPRSWPL